MHATMRQILKNRARDASQLALKDTSLQAATAQIYREWGVAIVRAECLLALLECSVPDASPRSARSEKHGDC